MMWGEVRHLMFLWVVSERINGMLTGKRTGSTGDSTDINLSKVGVELLSSNPLWLRCKKCGKAWSPPIKAGGKPARNYWKCPTGCNKAE